MKKLGLLTFTLFLISASVAQTDTVINFGNNKVYLKQQNGETKVRVINTSTDSAETLLFEGIYGEDSASSEVTTTFGFSKLIKTKHHQRHLDPHNSCLFLGFSSLADRDLNIADVNNAVLKYSSSEFGWTIFSMNLNIPKAERHGWLFFSGLGYRIHQYNSDNNTAFRLVNNYTTQVAAPANIIYSTSKLTNWYVHIPFMVEWQQPIFTSNFYIQAGIECGVLLSSKSKIMYRYNNEKTKEKIGSGMNVNPLTVDAKIGIGFGNYGLYARYGILREFRKGKGPDVYPIAIGIVMDL